jgi:hypothetical protein
MEFIESPASFYYNNLDEYADPRVKDWLGMSSPFPTIGISLSYVFIVKVQLFE